MVFCLKLSMFTGTGKSTPTYTVPERSLLTDTIAGAMFACMKSGVE